ncbi:MAG TPA: Hsp70 family protein [Pseudonocardiaceae bacterium]
MRDTIDFGIDLGTTNSAIAVADGATISVIKNVVFADTTPSVVRIPKPDVVQVGLKARGFWDKDPENVAAEFKLKMGLADAIIGFSRSGVTMTPTQLSAEVLKSLRADVTRLRGEPPDAAVITVPAAFGLNQSKATSDAAKLAGFTGKCPLVQEPTAAAFAYGLQDTIEPGYWLVFDLGGGTFDAAIVSKRDGELRVLHHAGDSYLGGSMIDWAIVEKLLVPAAKAELGDIELSRQNNIDLDVVRALATLKLAAEQAKIELSTVETTTIEDIELTVGGRTVEFDHELSRADLERLARPFYARAIQCCRTALREGELSPADIDRVLLVGGPTLAPGLRHILADPVAGLGIPLDFSQDPSTVVARGAALYASTVRVERVLAAPKRGEITVELFYPASTSSLSPTVGGKLHSGSTVDWTAYSVSLHDETARPQFHGDIVHPNAEGAFTTDVLLRPRSVARFTLWVTDPAGQRQHVEPDTLTITHREVEFEGQVLSVPLSIGLADNSVAVLLAKGVSLPNAVRERFVTSLTLYHGDPESVLRIPVLRGDHARADRNPEVGMLEIRSVDLRFDLPEGTAVHVTMKADNSGLLTVLAEVDVANIEAEADIDLDNVRVPEPGVLQELLAELELRVKRLRTDAGDSVAAQDQLAMFDLQDTLGTCRDLVRTAHSDVAAARAADEKLRDAHAALDTIDDAGQVSVLARELQDAIEECARLIRRSGREADRRELADLRERAHAAIAAGNGKAIRAQRDRAGRLIVEFLREEPDFPLMVFRSLCDRHAELPPSKDADALIRRGERAATVGDMRELDLVNAGLHRLIPPDIADPSGGLNRA